MATITHHDTYVCDLCGKEVERAVRTRVPVHSHYYSPAINEMIGEPWVSNGYGSAHIDLCFDCMKKVTVIDQFIEGDTETYKLKESE